MTMSLTIMIAPPVDLVGVALQGLHDRERAPIQLGQGELCSVALLPLVPHALPLCYHGGKSKFVEMKNYFSWALIYLNMSSSVISDSSPLELYSP